MSKALPSRPSLEQLKTQAKELLRALKAGESVALKRINENHPRKSSAGSQDQGALWSLSDAQLVIAREYGAANWLKLRERVAEALVATGDPMDPRSAVKYLFIRGEQHLFCFSNSKLAEH